jgi:hypothetical protein
MLSWIPTHGLFEHDLKLLALLRYVGGKLHREIGKVRISEDAGEYQDTVPSAVDLPRGLGFRVWSFMVWGTGF